jgi:hypothetical protein
MRTWIPALAALLLAPPVLFAEGMYRCTSNGKPVFTDMPGPGCEPLKLQVIPSDPQEVARIEEKKRQAEEQAHEQREQAERERVIRAQEDAARAAERQAEAQRRLADQQALDATRQERKQILRQPAYLWPGYGYPVRPQPPVINPPMPPEAPANPYLPNRIEIGGGRR